MGPTESSDETNVGTMSLGTMGLGDGERIDFRALRSERLARALAEMERDDLDALLLGREANVRFVSGARRLWTVGARPFAPTCALIRNGATIHLLSTWDDGIPPEIPTANLIQLFWDPRNLMAALKAAPGLADARRIGVDGMTPLFSELFSVTFPNAELADATPALERARLCKSPLEIACLRTAAALAEGAFAAMRVDIRPGADERALVGRYCEQAARLGVPIPAIEPGFCGAASDAASDRTPRRRSQHRSLCEGEWVRCHAGVLYAGYEGAVGLTIRCTDVQAEVEPEGQDETLDRLRESLIERCRPGASASDVCAAYADCGVAAPAATLVHGVGLGLEPPLAGLDVPVFQSEHLLLPGAVVALHAFVSDDRGGTRFARDTVLITETGCEVLNRLGRAR